MNPLDERYQVPISDLPLVVNRQGQFIRPDTNEHPPFNVCQKGYPTVLIKISGKWRWRFIHRLLAEMFIPKPLRHWDKELSELQVNHIDGNKLNFRLSNLEWVTGKENMEHARRMGLFGNEKKVMSRNIETGSIISYVSISDCARCMLVTASNLSLHLNSVNTGRIIVDGWVFKFDDGKPWPKLLFQEGDKDSISHTRNIVAWNELAKTARIFYSLKHACSELGLNLNVVKNNRTRKGNDIPCDGWTFKALSEYSEY